MEVQNVIVRKRLFKNVNGGWSSPMSVEEFILKNSDLDARSALVRDETRIRFVSAGGDIGSHKEGLNSYFRKESVYLEKCLREAVKIEIPVLKLT